MDRRTIAVLIIIPWLSLTGQVQKHKTAYDYVTVIDSWKVLRITGVNVRRPPSVVFTLILHSRRAATIDTVYAFWRGKGLKGKLVRNNNLIDRAVLKKGEEVEITFVDVPEMRAEKGKLVTVNKTKTEEKVLKVYLSINGELLLLTVHPKERKQLPEVLPQ